VGKLQHRKHLSFAERARKHVKTPMLNQIIPEVRIYNIGKDYNARRAAAGEWYGAVLIPIKTAQMPITQDHRIVITGKKTKHLSPAPRMN
jgi:hypothetical protein